MTGRPTTAIISTRALKRNYTALRRAMGPATEMMAVVKADAYGHGAVDVSRLLEALGCESFGVAMVEEGVELREAGIKAAVFVLGGVFEGQAGALFDYDLTPVVFDLETVEEIDSEASRRGVVKPVHVKVDTGMGRLGIRPDEALSFIRAVKALDGVTVEGILTHLAEADSPDLSFAAGQIAVFRDVVEAVRGEGVNPRYVHMANSAAIAGFRDPLFNLARPGIMLYGSTPAPHLDGRMDLEPVMEIRTRVMQVKSIPVGASVSYGRKFVARRPSRIAVLPIGYADGFSRRLSGKADVIIRGRRAPVVGLVCMDMTMCDVTDIDGVETGDEVVVLGRQGRERITVEEMAEKSGTISYEVFCNISRRVPRVYV